MLNVFSGMTANVVWQKALKKLLATEHVYRDSRLGEMLELTQASFRVEDPRQRWITSRKPSINPAFAIAEVFAILGGMNDAKFLNFWNPALPKYAGKTAEYYGAYGYRLKKQFQFDQIERAYAALKSTPKTRQVVLQIWDPKTDFPDNDGSPRSEDIPCNICSLLKVRDGKLDWMQVMRSNDLYRGTPYNFVQFTTLQEIMSGWLGLNVGSYCQVSDSLHLYKSDISEINKASSLAHDSRIKNTDDLRLPKTEWDQAFRAASDLMRMLSEDDLTLRKFQRVFSNSSIPKSYANLVLVAAADSARRRGWVEEMNQATMACENKMLVLLWRAWEARKLA
jgi:thymidylate synthase